VSDARTTVLAQWDRWLERSTDRLIDLDGRAPAAGTDRLDLAAAFVARKAIAARVDELRAAAGEPGEPDPAGRPVVDDGGQLVAADLPSAARLLDAIVERLEHRLDALERAEATVATALADGERDLAVAEPLARSLEQDVRRVAELRARLDGAPRDATALAPLATEAARVRAELETAAAHRDRLLGRWPALEGELVELTAREAEVRELVARCREKVRPLPVLAVPSVSALGPPEDAAELARLAWPGARARMEAYLDRVARVRRALDEVASRHRELMDRRDHLRGLLQSFRDKAGEHGVGEDAELERMFAHARELLWSAPCDVEIARGPVEAYVAAVNARVVP